MNTKIIHHKKHLKPTLRFFIMTFGILIPFLLSSNANAVNIVVPVTPTGTIYETRQAYHINQNNTVVVNSLSDGISITVPVTEWIKAIGDYTIREYKQGYYYTALIGVTTNYSDSQLFAQETLLWYPATSEYFEFISIEQISKDKVQQLSGGMKEYNPSTGESAISLWEYGPYSQFYEVTLRAKRDGNYRWQFGDGIHRVFNLPNVFNNPIAQSRTFQLGWIREFAFNSDIAEAEQKTEEQSNEGENNANQSETDNEQATQSVLSIIGNVIGAFSTGATDCKINADLGNLDLGDLDFCQHKPSEITNMINTFGSILVVYACYKVAKHIFGLWVKITTYAQGGNLTGGNE